MQLKHLFVSQLATAACRAAVVEPHPPCGNPAPSREYLQILAKAKVAEVSVHASTNVKRVARTVNTYLHIIAADNTRAGGAIGQHVIDNQMNVLNSNFGSTGYQFSLQGVDYTYDTLWSDIVLNRDLTNLKSSLRKGSYSDLNIYYFRSISAKKGFRLTGYCSNPGNGSDNKTFYNDGCNLHVETMPGGSYWPWNEGKITSHEVGHWFGLIHPWGVNDAGGCSGVGDLVDDTPAQYSANYGCQVGYDSCPLLPGTDPIHNFMGYSDNSCVNEFTQGQITRMNYMFNKYRG
ncbi:metalloprotease 1 [Cordyceps militaris]|uniref:Metalloprotease 1 n=1 Tax=Cordyceps militaris TaxID=73501 RepID=A0A2H4SFB1_CORMI|nr:metalloprotease 1 [Cordyceps militaris]